jgi:ABC-type transport system substrate-binding protein
VPGRHRGLAVVAALLAAVLAGCTQASAPVPPPAATPAPAPAEPTRLVVAVDDLGAGFNPHLLAHLSPTTTALATLVLPSVFRPDAAGELRLDRTVATSAEVVSTDPFTVSYELDLAASWSTNAPIAAEDFVYLWERMRGEPGVADAAGYRLITDVRSRAGGKAVDVVFAEPYPAWQRLFSNLLPAHILKDAPGSWTGALTGGLPASGGPFRIAAVDRARGEVVLARNDLYWDTPAVLDQLVLRRLEPDALTAGLTAGDVDVALSAADPQLRASLAEVLPPLRLQSAPQPTVTQLAMRVDAGPLSDPRVRRAVGALVDREAVRRAVAPGALPVDSFGLAPSEAGYRPTALPPHDAAEAGRLLAAAGWTRSASGRWRAAGRPVQVVVGAAAERADDVRIAGLVAAQLEAAGIDALVVAPPAVELFARPSVPPTPPTTAATATPSRPPTTGMPTPGTATPTSANPTGTAPLPPGTVQVDLTVMPRTVGGHPGSELASDYGCAAPTPVVPEPPPAPGGSCVATLGPLLDGLLTGVAGEPLRTVVDRELQRQLPALPLFQPATLVVSTAGAHVATGIGPGPLGTGPLTGAQRWVAPRG